jgi:hypothetical protein
VAAEPDHATGSDNARAHTRAMVARRGRRRRRRRACLPHASELADVSPASMALARLAARRMGMGGVETATGWRRACRRSDHAPHRAVSHQHLAHARRSVSGGELPHDVLPGGGRHRDECPAERAQIHARQVPRASCRDHGHGHPGPHRQSIRDEMARLAEHGPDRGGRPAVAPPVSSSGCGSRQAVSCSWSFSRRSCPTC